MLKILLTLSFLVSSYAFAGEYTDAQKEADTDLCVAVTSLVRTTKALRSERAIESVGGVKNLSTMRQLSENFARELREFGEANEAQEKAHGRVKNFSEDCEDISAKDEADMTAEVEKYAKALKHG